MKHGKNEVDGSGERAVSPVIGVILMVAITVILAAVIAAFVLGIGPGGEPVNAVVDIEGDAEDHEITLQLHESGNAEEFIVRADGEVFKNDGTESEVFEFSGVGDTVKLTDEGLEVPDDGGEYEFTVVAIAGDDESVINDYTIEFEGNNGG